MSAGVPQTLLHHFSHCASCSVSTDRDDIFLDEDRKLVKYAPPTWTQASDHAPFTVFFRVKFYVENVNQLRSPLTLHLYYLQLRQDLLGQPHLLHCAHALYFWLLLSFCGLLCLPRALSSHSPFTSCFCSSLPLPLLLPLSHSSAPHLCRGQDVLPRGPCPAAGCAGPAG